MTTRVREIDLHHLAACDSNPLTSAINLKYAPRTRSECGKADIGKADISTDPERAVGVVERHAI